MNSISITQKEQRELIQGYKALSKSNVDDETQSIEIAKWLDEMFKKSLTNGRVKTTLDKLNSQILNLKDKVLDKFDCESEYDRDEHNSGIQQGKKGEWYFNPDY